LVLDSEVVALEGRTKDGILGRTLSAHAVSGRETRRIIRHLFLFIIGADPNTSWLSHCDVVAWQQGLCAHRTNWESSAAARATASLFAVVDVLAGSVKRVAGGRQSRRRACGSRAACHLAAPEESADSRKPGGPSATPTPASEHSLALLPVC